MHRKQLTLFVCAALVAMTVGFQASAEKMILENGDEVDVDVIGESNGVTTIEHPQLGRIEVPSASINPPPPKPIAPGLFGTSVLRGWDKNLGFGFSGASGVSNDLSLNASLSVQREADTYRGKFTAGYFFSKAAADQTTSKVNTSNEAFVAYEHDFIIKESRWFVFAAARYDYNEFQAYEHRPAANAGIGYDFIKREKLKLKGKAGAGYSYQFGTIDTGAPEGVFALDFRWDVFEGHRFTWDLTYYPNFDVTPDFRLLANAAYSIGLMGIEGLAFKVGIQDEFNWAVPTFTSSVTSITEAGERNNLKYYGNITYEF